MACPGGCIGGGGQPRSADKGILAVRVRLQLAAVLSPLHTYLLDA
jgi:iron only hydrogenase large subunit-like protein